MFRSRVATLIAIGVLGWVRALCAAPCCGGGSSLPSLIAGDDRAQLAASFLQGSVIGDAPAQGIPVFRGDFDSEVTKIFRLDGAYRISDEFQMGAGVPIVRRARGTSASSASATGLGDATLDVAYEFLPEMSYSAWRPKGFVFLQTTLPMSPSVYEVNDPFLLSARGRGFFSLAAGSAFVKAYRDWDFSASLEFHRSFSRSFRAPDGSILDLSPGYGGSAIFGAGLSPGGGAIRLGLSVSPVYEGAVQSSGSVDSVSDSQLVWNTSLQLGFAGERGWSAGLSYTDQTLLGPVKNVSLSRTVAVTTQKRWEL